MTMGELEQSRAGLEEQLRAQAAAIRASSPAPDETPAEALAAVEASIRDLEAPEYALVAGGALEELRAFRAELLAAD